MNTELIVEDNFSISSKDILQSRVYMTENNTFKSHPNFTYWTEGSPDVSEVLISVEGEEPQSFDFEWVNITFGKRPYFQCSCGLRVSRLYILTDGKEFKCRKCHKLQYFLTTFNKNSIAGQQF